jgi:Tol biopolymer transport system component
MPIRWTQTILRAFGVVALVIGGVLLVASAFGSLLPRGDQVAFMGSDDGIRWDIYLLDVERQLLERVTHSGGSDRYPAWSPDGQTLLFHSDRSRDRQVVYDLYTVGVDGRHLRRLTDDNIRAAAELSPDVFSALGSAMGAWSPDGTLIAFHSDLGGIWDLYLLDVATLEVERLTYTPMEAVLPAWSPDGTTLAYSYGDLEARYLELLRLSDRTRTQITHASDTTQRADFLPPAPPTPTPLPVVPALQATATALAQPLPVPGLPPVASVPPLHLSVVEDWHPSWSPDGTRIVFASSRDFAQDELYILALASGSITQITANSVIDNNPIWLPDGERIAFTSERDGLSSLYVMDLETGVTRRLLPRGLRVEGAAWRP